MVFAFRPAMSKPERAGIAELCTSLRRTDVSEQVASQMLDQISRRNAARSLALAALEYADGRGALDKVQELSTAVATPTESQEESSDRCWITSSLAELRHDTIAKGGLYWPLKSLNFSLGPLRKGDFGFVFARPETGKTTFLAHTASFMAGPTEAPVVWFNNEEQGGKVRGRT